MEMKMILKTIPSNFNLKYDKMFISQANVKIRRKLIPELIKSLKLNFHPSHEQLLKWLILLYKSRRS